MASRRIPSDWRSPPTLGYFAYRTARRQGQRPGGRPLVREGGRHPWELPATSCASRRCSPARAGRTRRRSSCGARSTWAATSTRGRRRSRSSSASCPTDKAARMKAVAPLYDTMPKADFEALIAELFKGVRADEAGVQALPDRHRRRLRPHHRQLPQRLGLASGARREDHRPGAPHCPQCGAPDPRLRQHPASSAGCCLRGTLPGLRRADQLAVPGWARRSRRRCSRPSRPWTGSRWLLVPHLLFVSALSS